MEDSSELANKQPTSANIVERTSIVSNDGTKLRKVQKRSESMVAFQHQKDSSYFSKMGPHLYSGALKKKGRKSGSLKKRLYFIKGNFMYYFAKKSDDLPRGIMYLPNKLFQQSVVNGKNCIKIFTSDSSFHYKTLYGSYKEDTTQWFEALLTASNNEDILKDFDLKETLGVGKFSTVRKGYLKSDASKSFAVKIISKKNMTESEKEYIMNEIAILKAMNNPNVPKVYGMHETHDKLHIVMEIISGGELFDYLVDANSLPFEEALTITHKLFKILKYLKEFKIMHRDIKTENLMITKDKKGVMKKVYLIDFGLAKFLDSREQVNNKLGTMGYCAPEIILKEAYNESVDMWSAGVVFYLLIAGKLPFDDKSNSVISEKTVKKPITFLPKPFNNIDSKVKSFIEQLCQKKALDRLSVEEALSLCSSLKE